MANEDFLTPEATSILGTALLQAQKRGHLEAGSLHLMLALASCEVPVVIKLCAQVKGKADFLGQLEEALSLLGAQPRLPDEGARFSLQVQEILERSYKIALETGKDRAAPEHLLFGLIATRELDFSMLAIGVDLPALRQVAWRDSGLPLFLDQHNEGLIAQVKSLIWRSNRLLEELTDKLSLLESELGKPPKNS